MTARCIALLSGGLDSILAIRIMLEFGIKVEAVNFKTVFTCCQDVSGQAARDLGVRLTVIQQEDDYLDLVKRPVYGYGKGANPCVDCRIYMFEHAWKFAKKINAQFLISGEVIGQRPMSQKRRDLDIIEDKSGLEDRLLRPLSAKLLPPTWPERNGLVDRSRLYDFVGRSRKGLIELAHKFGIENIPTPSTGCALTEKQFGKKVHDLVQREPNSGRWDFELLKTGRHFRYDAATKVVVGRNSAENETLEYMHELPESNSTVMLRPDNFVGPLAIIIGLPDNKTIEFAGSLLMRYSKRFDVDNAQVQVHIGENTRLQQFRSLQTAADTYNIATV